MILHAVVGGVADLHNGRSKTAHHEGVAAEVGEVDQLLAIDDLPLRGVGGLEQRSLFSNHDGLGDFADFEFDICGNVLLSTDNDALAFRFLEACLLDNNSISIGVDVGKNVFAGATGDGRATDSGGFFKKSNLGIGNSCTALVDNASAKVAISALCPTDGRKHQ